MVKRIGCRQWVLLTIIILVSLSLTACEDALFQNLRGDAALVPDQNQILLPTGPPVQENESGLISIERTATGGYIHTLLIFLTFISFIGNGFFLVDAFWMIG
jgi:hypothetical protein